MPNDKNSPATQDSSSILDPGNTQPQNPPAAGQTDTPSFTNDPLSPPLSDPTPPDNNTQQSFVESDQPEVNAPHAPKKYGGKKIIATIFGILFLIGGVAAGVYLVQRQQELAERAASGKECSQSPDCILLDEPGNKGSFTAPRRISHVLVTAQDVFRFDPPGKNDGCYDVDIDGSKLNWERIGDGSACKDVSNVQVWLGGDQPTNTPVPTTPPAGVSCPLSPQSGRTIVILNPSKDNQIRSDQTEAKANFGPVSTNVSPGAYKVTLVSYDNHSEHNPPQNQPKEQWYLITNSSGNTGTIADLPDSDDWLTQVVNENFNITSALTSVTAHHAAYPTTTSANSVSPVCAAFDKIETPVSPTPTTPPAVTAQCLGVKTYDKNWNLLSSEDLSKLKKGDIVRFATAGSASAGTFDKARFTVNGTLRPEVTTKKPGSDEFYDQYTIPESVSNFTVKGEVHHSSLGWF